MKSTFKSEDAQKLFSQWDGKWYVAGGHAVDLFLGKRTREHEDLDILIFRKDVSSVRNFLKDWDLWIGLGEGRLEETALASLETFPEDKAVLWARPHSQAPWAFEFLINDSEGEEWICKRDATIKRGIDEIGGVTKGGIPFLCPEIVLLHKAKGLKDKDVQDFENTLSCLSDDAKSWLQDSLWKINSGHPWLSQF